MDAVLPSTEVPPEIIDQKSADVLDGPSAKSALTPPTSEDLDKKDGSSSELSELEDDEDDEWEIEPDHYFDGGKIPVFKPVCTQLLVN